MSNRRPRIPKYRHYKPKNLAVVRIEGKDYYLGKYDSPESREKYRRRIAEWLNAGLGAPLYSRSMGPPSFSSGSAISINELILAYWQHARAYYVKHGLPTDEQSGIRSALRYVRRLYGATSVCDFGPQKLKTVRQAMIDADLSRGVINQYVNRIRRMFKWGVENELVAVDIYQALTTVAGLRKGRSSARERPRIAPVPDENIEATLPYLFEVVRAMVQFQRLTGCRPQDVCRLRPCDVDTTSDVWCYQPPTHKMEHRGRPRKIFIGPRGQEILRPWMNRPPEAYCFSPRESAAACLVARRKKRKDHRTASQTTQERPKHRKRAPGDFFSRHSYRQAIQRACRRAGVPRWTPNQLRHSRGTEVRKHYGLEASQTVLGHSRANVTELYAERDEELARRIAEVTG